MAFSFLFRIINSFSITDQKKNSLKAFFEEFLILSTCFRVKLSEFLEYLILFFRF